MQLDPDRLAEVLAFDYSYYTGPEPECAIDERLNPSAGDFIAVQLEPTMDVLDIGCGNGATLLRNAERFAHGTGIDHDKSHLELATDALAAASVSNVSFHAMDAVDLPAQPWRERFDFVVSERGPVSYDVRGVQAALHVLRTGGMLFAEVIGDLHHQEVREIFGGTPRFNQLIRALDHVKVAMERCGVEVRVAADLVSKRRYPDIYEWMKFQCGIWAWTGTSPPAPTDPRWELFAERNSDRTGSIEVTHHVVWVGGIKAADPPPYNEYRHFAEPSQ